LSLFIYLFRSIEPSGVKSMSSEQVQTQLAPPEVLSWLAHRFAEWLKLDPEEIDARQPISQYGLDSISAVTLSVYLEEELGVKLDTALLWDHPTLESLALHLTEKLTEHGMTRLPVGRT
jgi:acyl carrier protein